MVPRGTVVLLDTGTRGTEKYSGSTGHRNSWYREVQWFYWTQELLVPRGTVVLLDTGTPGTEKYSGSTGHRPTPGTERYSGSTGHRNSWYREVQWFYWTQELLVPRGTVVLLDTGTPGTGSSKYIMMQYTDWINSTPSQQ